MITEENILLFDGNCKLCSCAVCFVLRHEANPIIKFASLQSDFGKYLLQNLKIKSDTIDSVVFVTKQKAFFKSRALIEITLFLRYPYKAFFILKWLPFSWMDFMYDIVAKYRYKIFGEINSCEISGVSHLDRFLLFKN